MPALALDPRGDACLQEHRVEGFQQVVVGTGLDAGNDLVHILTATDHDHRGRAQTVVLFHAPQHLGPANARHHEIKQYNVYSTSLEKLQRFFTRFSGNDGMSCPR